MVVHCSFRCFSSLVMLFAVLSNRSTGPSDTETSKLSLSQKADIFGFTMFWSPSFDGMADLTPYFNHVIASYNGIQTVPHVQVKWGRLLRQAQLALPTSMPATTSMSYPPGLMVPVSSTLVDAGPKPVYPFGATSTEGRVSHCSPVQSRVPPGSPSCLRRALPACPANRPIDRAY